MSGRGGGTIAVLQVVADRASGPSPAEGVAEDADDVAVRTATSVEDALAALEAGAVDCVVADLDRGRELLGALPAGREDGVPVVLLIDDGEEAAAMAALADGADRYLNRSVDRETLAGAIESAVRSSVQRRRLARADREAAERYRSLFENNPFIVWEEDFSETKAELDALAGEVEDLAAYLGDNPDEVRRLMGTIEFIDVNENALEYYGASSKAELVENLDAVFTEEAYGTVEAMLVSVAAGETTFRGETVARTLDGERRHELLEMNVPAAYADDYSRVYVTAIDITERKARERELQRERDRLEEFASVISHDLRSPLGVARGRLELLDADPGNEHVEAIAASLDRMEGIIEDTLTLAKQGRSVGSTSRVDVTEVAEGCWQSAGTPAATLEIAASFAIEADHSRLRNLFENLFRNAVEHAADSSGEGEAGVEATDEHDGEAVTVRVGPIDGEGFYVEDDGPGIPEDERDSVLEAGTSTAPDGTGFGLSIVRRIAEAHGWTVTITDGTDGGARFEFTGVAVLDR